MSDTIETLDQWQKHLGLSDEDMATLRRLTDKEREHQLRLRAVDHAAKNGLVRVDGDWLAVLAEAGRQGFEHARRASARAEKHFGPSRAARQPDGPAAKFRPFDTGPDSKPAA